MDIDKAREYVVIVNGGSGCLIQPMTDEYMYILTAKHNITDSNNTLERIVHFKFIDGNWIASEIQFEQLLEGSNYFPHPEKDIAIIKTKNFLQGYDGAFRFDRLADQKNNYHLLGYPEIRRKNNLDNVIEWYRRDSEVQIYDSRANGQFEAGIQGNANISEVRGDSGGGIVKVSGKNLYIAGIQNKMADADEQMGRIRFTPLKCFDEIIDLYSDKLASIFPCHLKSFSFLKNEAFNLSAGFYQADIEFVKNYLNNKTNEVIKSPLTPVAIKKLFERRLLLFNQGDETLQSKFVWLVWLEFLTILNLLKNEDYTEESLTDIFNNIRLICSDTDQDWSSELTNIIYSDFKGLKRNGIVIVGVKNPPINDLYVLDKKIPMISQAIKSHNRKLLQIDEGINFPLSEYKFIHVEYFKKQAIISKYFEYAEIEDDEVLLSKLKTEYKILLENE